MTKHLVDIDDDALGAARAELGTATLKRHLANKSQRGRKIPDLLVAAAAEAERLTLLHYDPGFDNVAKVTGQPCAWVVPAGSVG